MSKTKELKQPKETRFTELDKTYGLPKNPQLKRPKTSQSASNFRDSARNQNNSTSNSPVNRNRKSMAEMQKQVTIHKKQQKRDISLASQIVDMCV